MPFQLESLISQPENFVSEHTLACSLVETTGHKTKRWADSSNSAVLYLISREIFGDGIAFSDWFLFICGRPIKFSTSASMGPGVKSHHLKTVAAPMEAAGQERKILALINEALNAYFTSYEIEFWEITNFVPDIKINLNTTHTKWQFLDIMPNGQNER